jgi:ribosomal protein L28
MMICYICGKGKVVGRSQKHKRGVAGKRWKNRVQSTPRLFLPNLQMKTVEIAGEKKKMKLCAKCIKRIKKYESIKDYTEIKVL